MGGAVSAAAAALVLRLWLVANAVSGQAATAGDAVTPGVRAAISVIRVVSGPRLSPTNLDSAGRGLADLLEATLKTARDRSGPRLTYLIFLGDLFALTGNSVADAPATSLLAAFATGAQAWAPWAPDYSKLLQIRAALVQLNEVGVRTFWLPGAREPGLTQDHLVALNHGPVAWITVPEESNITLHRVFLTVGHSLDFFAAKIPPLDEDAPPDLPFSAYLDRATGSRGEELNLACAPDAEFEKEAGGDADLEGTGAKSAVSSRRSTLRATRAAVTGAVQSSPKMTLAVLENRAFVRSVLRTALESAVAGAPGGCNVSKLAFASGDWDRMISATGHFKNAGRTVTGREVIDHYKSIGARWVRAFGEAHTANVVYATASGDLRPLLRLKPNKHDVAILGHSERTYFNEPSFGDQPIIRLGRWQYEPSVANRSATYVDVILHRVAGNDSSDLRVAHVEARDLLSVKNTVVFEWRPSSGGSAAAGLILLISGPIVLVVLLVGGGVGVAAHTGNLQRTWNAAVDRCRSEKPRESDAQSPSLASPQNNSILVPLRGLWAEQSELSPRPAAQGRLRRFGKDASDFPETNTELAVLVPVSPIEDDADAISVHLLREPLGFPANAVG